MPRSLTISDVARIRNTDRTAAYRWLLRNAKRHMRRRGKLWIISARTFALLHEAQPDPRIEKRFQALEERMENNERRTDAHARALSNLHAL